MYGPRAHSNRPWRMPTEAHNQRASDYEQQLVAQLSYPGFISFFRCIYFTVGLQRLERPKQWRRTAKAIPPLCFFVLRRHAEPDMEWMLRQCASYRQGRRQSLTKQIYVSIMVDEHMRDVSLFSDRRSEKGQLGCYQLPVHCSRVTTGNKAICRLG